MNIASTTEWLHLHQNLGYFLVFSFSFAESLAFLSIAFPGTLLLIAAGFLAFHGAFSPAWLIVTAALGAFLGDALSFLIGYKSSGFLKRVRLSPKSLAQGRDFLHRHGLWAVILGKFIGPLRCVVPLLAGMVRMNAWLFFVIEGLSAPLWAASLTFTGYFFYRSYGALQGYLNFSALFGGLAAPLAFFAYLWLRRRSKKKKLSSTKVPL